MTKEISGCFRETASLVEKLRQEIKDQCGDFDNVKLQGKYHDKDTKVWGVFSNLGLDNDAINKMFEEGTEDHCIFLQASCISDDLSNAGKQNVTEVGIFFDEYIAGHTETILDEN